MKRAFITGANRGLGLELTRQLVDRGVDVVATCRVPDEAEPLQALAAQHPARVRMLALDVRDDASVAHAVERLDGTIDTLFNNAGVNHRASLDRITPAMMLEALDVNAVGALRMILALRGRLQGVDDTVPRIVNISSQLGSLTAQRPGFGSIGYNVSKAALNMITRQVGFALQGGALVVSIHPGWVQTDMGAPTPPSPCPTRCAASSMSSTASPPPTTAASSPTKDAPMHGEHAAFGTRSAVTHWRVAQNARLALAPDTLD